MENKYSLFKRQKSQKFIVLFLIVKVSIPGWQTHLLLYCWLKDTVLLFRVIIPALGIDVVCINHRCSLGFQLVGRRKRKHGGGTPSGRQRHGLWVGTHPSDCTSWKELSIPPWLNLNKAKKTSMVRQACVWPKFHYGWRNIEFW